MKRTHLMYQHTPFSACGYYVGNHLGMIQTFDIDKTDCKMCLKKLEEYKENTKREEDKGQK